MFEELGPHAQSSFHKDTRGGTHFPVPLTVLSLVISLAAASRAALALVLILPGLTSTIFRCLAGSWERTSDLSRLSMIASSSSSFSSPRLEEPE